MTAAPPRQPPPPKSSRAERRGDPSPESRPREPRRFELLWAAAVYAACTLSLAWPILAGKFLVNPHSDQMIAGFSFREFAAQSLRAGEGFPQWNPFLYGGMPYIAAMHGDIFYPTFLLRMLMPTDLGMSLGFALHLFLAGIATFAFLRAWGISFFPALIGGVAYMLSGQLAGLASPGHDGKLFVSALLPVVLLCLVRGIRDGRHWAWGALAVAIGLAVLSPHPQLLQYLLLTAGAFSLYLAFAANEAGSVLPRKVAISRLGFALVAVVVGGLIGAIQFLPVREYVEWSPRAGGRDYSYSTSYSFPIEELINSYLPQFSGILDKYWGRNGIHFHSEYLGAAVLFLAGGAVGMASHRSFRRFWLGVLVVGVLWALGGNTPFYRIVYELVPGTKFFRAPSTIYFVYAFAVAVFAAFGAQRLLARALSRTYVVAWVATAAAVALLLSAGGAGVLTQSLAESIAAGYPPEYASRFSGRAAANVGDVVLGGWRSLFFVAMAGGIALLLAGRRVSGTVAAWALVAVVAIDMWSVARHYWIFSPPAATLFESDAAVEAIRAAPPGRVIAVDFMGSAPPREPAFVGDALMAHGIRLLQGYHGNELGRYDRLLELAAQDPAAQGAPFLSPGLWRHQNVRYLYTTLPDSVAPELEEMFRWDPLQRLAGPSRNASGTTVFAYRLPGENPPAWLASAAVWRTDDQALQIVLDPRFDPSLAAVIPDTSDIAEFGANAESRPQAHPLPQVVRFDPGAIDIELANSVSEQAMLVVSENYFPGWTATADGDDGRELSLTRANFNLIGVVVPPGVRRVELRFRDPAYDTGKAVTLFALAVALLGIIGGAVLDRRRLAAGG